MKSIFRRLSPFILTLLIIEFLDEFVYGAREAAWPLIRDDLGLSYWQIGVLLGMPGLIGSLIEPAIGILGDVWKRRVLILGGGVIFAGSALLTSISGQFWLLFLAFSLFSPASGAFVSLSQAALMDEAPDRHQQNMARWTFAGSVGVVAGPLALGGAVLLGIGWRGFYSAFGVMTLLILGFIWRFPFPSGGGSNPGKESSPGFRSGLQAAITALRRREVLRWLTLLEFSDLLLDVLLGFLALYLVDIVGVTPQQAGIAIAVWSGFGLLGDFLLIPLLERVSALRYLRVSVVIEFFLYFLFLITPPFWVKLTLLGLLGFFNSGWYSILKGNLYSEMPGQSGTVMTLGNLFGFWGSLIPLGLGWVGQRWGLSWSMWLLISAPVILWVGIAGKISSEREDENETWKSHSGN